MPYIGSVKSTVEFVRRPLQEKGSPERKGVRPKKNGVGISKEEVGS